MHQNFGTMKQNKIVIIGAGLSGTLLAIRLAQRGFNIELYEKRPDMRLISMSAGRSINLALSDRGIEALKLIGMDDFMLSESIPMTGRMIHSLDGSLMLQNYSGRQGEYINSISRGGLNIGLLDKAESFSNIQLFFDHDCTHADLDAAEVYFKLTDGTTKAVTADLIIGTDGAGSAIRQSFVANGPRMRFSYSQDFLSAGYKELHIPPTEDGGFKLEKNALHIWPRGGFMMIGLPNMDGSYTMTLFTDFEGEAGFDDIQTESDVEKYFMKYFPDAYALMPSIKTDYFANPASSLGTIKCYPWQYGGRFLLLGDAAHAVVPFYGQGMNCSFEDCVVFDQCIEKYGSDWQQVLKEFQVMRKPNADAIADLAVANYTEMRDLVADATFIKKRKLETKLENLYPDYFSKYSMVTFRADLPYEYAKVQGEKQNELLMDICSKIDNVDELNTDDLMLRIRLL